MKQRGFTLLEVLIVLVIIAVLMAIALPIYQSYISKSHVGAVNAEVASLKTAFDICVSDGRLTPATCNLGATSSKFQAPGGNTSNGGAPPNGGVPVMSMSADGSGTITATFGGTAQAKLAAAGATLTYARDASGNWSCTTSAVPVDYVPTGCRDSAAP